MEQEERGDLEDISIGSAKSSISLNEPESQSDLLTKLLATIQLEKIPGVLAVRKGRVSVLYLHINYNIYIIFYISI